jgi:tellurite resistance protein
MSCESFGYYVNDKFSFTIIRDEKGRKLGKLVNVQTGETLAEDMYQRVVPENIDNLINVAKLLIGAAWQDGKIEESEKRSFYKAFENVEFSDSQKKEIEKEFSKPTPVKELVAEIKGREEKLLVLETALLLIIADNEFHPKEKEFIEYLVNEFNLDSEDYALLYYILPDNVKKYIVKEKLHDTLKIRSEEIATLDKLSSKAKADSIDHNQVYHHFINSWKNRSTRYKRDSVY